jgi:prophage maintenance system killer protein
VPGSRRACRIRYPTLRVVERIVEGLRELYPGDPIRWKGGGREQVEQAIAAARWTFRFTRGQPCHARKLAAAAALFYEIITLHPLTDGNKRLATVMLWAFLRVNGLPRPRMIAEAALRVTGGEWGQEDVYQWLLRVYRAWKARGKRGG